ncbi:MAG: hypothetical protein LDL39_16080, partial [Magnetospirillum sp.]|nr:hypothetical protein [Magnetospirillum sp.]
MRVRYRLSPLPWTLGAAVTALAGMAVADGGALAPAMAASAAIALVSGGMLARRWRHDRQAVHHAAA